MGWKSLGLFFAENFGMASITSGYFGMVSMFFGRLKGDSAYEISVFDNWARSIDAPGKEFCSLGIRTPEYDRKMGVVNPTSFPIYFWLHCRKPWIAEDGLVLAEIGEEELK